MAIVIPAINIKGDTCIGIVIPAIRNRQSKYIYIYIATVIPAIELYAVYLYIEREIDRWL